MSYNYPSVIYNEYQGEQEYNDLIRSNNSDSSDPFDMLLDENSNNTNRHFGRQNLSHPR